MIVERNCFFKLYLVYVLTDRKYSKPTYNSILCINDYGYIKLLLYYM